MTPHEVREAYANALHDLEVERSENEKLRDKIDELLDLLKRHEWCGYDDQLSTADCPECGQYKEIPHPYRGNTQFVSMVGHTPECLWGQVVKGEG